MEETNVSSGSSKMFLVVAGGLAVLAAAISFTFISATAMPEGNKSVKIVVAKRDLSPSAVIDPGRDLMVEEIPAKYTSAAQRTLDPAALATYKGQKVNRRVTVGTPVYLADLGAGGELVVAPGHRALSIRAAAGLAATGDHVKILEQGSGVIIGQGDGFRVLAIGITLNTNRNQVTKAEQDASANPARLVTLEVTDAQAMDIAKQLHSNPENNMLLVTPPPSPATSQAEK